MTQEHENPGDPRLSFDNAADIYNGIRPHYPPAMFLDLFRFFPDAPAIVEMGPGTSQATVDLLEHGATVTAREIGRRLAAKLQEVVKSEGLSIVVGDFETVQLPEHSYDAIFSATAYHWIS